MDESPQSPITDLIFDSGGVIFTNGTNIVLDQFQKILRKPRELLLRIFSGDPQWGPPDKAGVLYREGKINRDEFWARVGSQLGIEDTRQLSKMEQMWFDAYVPIPGMIELLEKLRPQYTLTLWTGNIPERIKYLDDRYKLLQYFQKTCYSYVYRASKEDDNFYNALKDVIAPVTPEHAIVIDDKHKYVFKARKTGFNAILFESTSRLVKDLQKFGVVIDGTTEIGKKN